MEQTVERGGGGGHYTIYIGIVILLLKEVERRGKDIKKGFFSKYKYVPKWSNESYVFLFMIPIRKEEFSFPLFFFLFLYFNDYYLLGFVVRNDCVLLPQSPNATQLTNTK